jgi:hypothetical protein
MIAGPIPDDTWAFMTLTADPGRCRSTLHQTLFFVQNGIEMPRLRLMLIATAFAANLSLQRAADEEKGLIVRGCCGDR